MEAVNDKYIPLILNDPNYKITSDGKLLTRRSSNGMGLMPKEKWREVNALHDSGYYQCHRRINGVQFRISIHRIVYQYFYGDLNPDLMINHKDGNKLNNHPDNLEQVTCLENNRHTIKVLGYSPIKNFVVTKEIADKIREEHKTGLGYGKLAKKFNCSKTTVAYIIQGKIWK